MSYYKTADDINFRLANTYIFYDGQLVYCVRAGIAPNGQLGVTIQDLPDLNNMRTVPLDDPKLNFYKMRIGYVNGRDQAFYLVRSPQRQTQQGLSDKNVWCRGVKGGFERQRFSGLVPLRESLDSLRGKYPTFDDCALRIDERRASSLAFHRSFALSRKDLGCWYLNYKGEAVAWGSPDGFNLGQPYKHLRECIEESGIRVKVNAR